MNPSQKDANRHHRMAGAPGGWQAGDIILVPNIPRRRMFSLARVTGPYRYEPMTLPDGSQDFGHIREVELLTQNGVANTSHYVGSGLRHTLTTRSRTWEIRKRDEDFAFLLDHLDEADLIEESRATDRFQRVIDQAEEKVISAFTDVFRDELFRNLGKAEWEPVIARALQSNFPNAQVKKTGGPSERDADIEILFDNPIGGANWIIVVQVKDWSQKAGASPVKQLRDAIETRTVRTDDGLLATQVIGAVLALTEAEPSDELVDAMDALERETDVPTQILYGEEFQKLILEGLLRVSR
ncbi:restriction endonuclease [Pacificitalea manganoxidans]|nr:restriction endonuclease [Pacificitalea manganoxidans]MDR6308081.1 putative Mrr-cat superfamily restriction endonuclease [Pacificitalea manganoxidans]